MGSLARNIRRKQQKMMFEKFKDDWRIEKNYQQLKTSEGKGPDPKDSLIGKKRPTFGMWKGMMDRVIADRVAKLEEAAKKAPQAEDLSWDEEAAKPSEPPTVPLVLDVGK
jgi:hypothetical protein